MEQKSLGVAIILGSVILAGTVAVGSLVLPSWGKLQIAPVGTVTVTGEAKSEQKTQVAIFSAGVNAYNDDKNTAVSEVNKKVAAIIEAVQQFGIVQADIKTQSLNVYQNQESYYEDGRQKMRPGQWNVGNTIEIKLRNVDQASALAGLLTKTGATNVYGPNFTFDDTSDAATALFDAAIKNAQEKAGKVAASSGRKLGKVLSLTEGMSSSPIFSIKGEFGGGGGGAPVSPGTDTVVKSVTVTYELQ
jgi:uncharacterized protein YggE